MTGLSRRVLAAVLLLLWTGAASAGEAAVVAVEAAREGDGTWRFDVTVAHGDEGWDHYADKWEVLAPDGRVLGARVLLHPHVGEQPSPAPSAASRSRSRSTG